MASSSVGSDIFAILSLLFVSTAVLLVIRYHLPLRTTPAYLLVPVFLALVLPCSIILLVPIDLASGGSTKEIASRGVWLPGRVVLVTWRITYWLTFVLTWFILPFLGEFCDSGYLELGSRAKDSLRNNARYQMIVLGSAVAGLIYFVLQNGFHWATLKGLVMALAYAWGLVLAIGLMGHGLVSLPRRLYTFATVPARLRRIHSAAPKIKDRLDDADTELEELENAVWQLRQRKHGIANDLQEWIDELSETTAVPNGRVSATSILRTSNMTVPAVITERYLADLTRKLKRARHKKARFADEWVQLCQRAREAKTILDATSSKRLDFGQTNPSQSVFSRVSFLTPSMRYHLHMNVKPALRMALAGALALASTMVVWSEIVKGFAPKLSVIGLTVVHHLDNDGGAVGFAGQIIAAAWLIYMDLCALYAIADVKVWGNRALVRRQTYGESACWYSLQVAKLTVPLSYNFITMLPQSVYQETSFYTFLGKLITLTPLGTGFSAFFPCFVLVPVLASMFNVYGRLKGVFGFSVLEDDDENNPTGDGTGGWREGRALIEREISAGNNAAASSVGLSSRGASVDIERRPGTLPSASASSISSQPRQTATWGNPFDNRNASRPPVLPEDDESPRHFYQDFTERVRNTLDVADTANWMKNIGSAFKAPKWLQNDQRDGDGGSALSKWFGGRPDDGRLRL